jgi:ATP-dependent exoDNAse (exonuclease V) beta subunit
MAVNGGLFDLMQKAVKFYREHSGIYNTGTQILSKFYTLGILTDLAKEIRQYVFENNVFILADTGSLLRTLIGNNDAPFIYEKTGQAFRYFMIDEFQDTSQIQWDNFKPLISNSLGEGHTNLLVGDIKQSIYRWRNSDWRIMSEQVENDFVQHDYSIQSLLVNWRSTYNIIAFNNSIFSQLPSVLQQKFNSDCKADSENIEVATSLQNIIKKVFEDSAQLLPHRESKEKGYVNTGFFENDDNLWKDRMKPALIHVVEELQNKSYGLKDIAILVRTGNEGREIAELFAEQNKQKPADSPYRYDVISNDSIYLKNSPLVRFIIAFIRYLLQPENLINKAFVKYEYEKYLFPGNSQNDLEDFSFFSEEMENLVIACKIIEREKYLSLSPDEFLEFLILTFQLNRNKEQLVFLQAFQDCVSDFINKYSPELGRFLDYWEEKKDKLTISISEDQDAIRILTIHKAKGLEFKNVIVPFCNWSLDQNARHDNFLWCKSEEAPFNKLDYLPVRYSSSLRNTLFQNFYFAEKARAYIDNLNLLYVTFTRAKQNIFAFAPFPKRKKSDDEFTINTVGDLLFNVFNSAEKMQVSEEFPCIRLNDYWDGNKKIFSFGKLTFSEFSNETPINISELTDYQSYEIKEKLKQHFQWSIPDEADDQLADTPMAIGNLMHRVFQNIVTVHDIEPALQSFLFEGIISSDEKESLRKTILEKLSQQPLADWFSGKWTVKNEADIIVSKQSMVRPDRVMIKDKNAIVVDYKFGMMQNARYTTQVRDYAGYLMQMGYNKVEGFVWYVSMDIIERVA